MRQLAVITAVGDRRARLRKLSLPAAVIHGTDDKLFPVACGKDTASAIPGASLQLIEEMAHDFPEQLMPVFSDTITDLVDNKR